MYNYSPYMPYMPDDIYRPYRKDYEYPTDDYMSMGMSQMGMQQMGMPMGMPQMGMQQMGMPMGMPQMGVQQMGMPMGCVQPYYMEKEKRCVKVPEVIGRNYTQILLENEIPFAPGCPALEIKDIKKDVVDLENTVCKDKVLINGKLHKNINYKTLNTCGRIKCACNELDLLYGDVKHVSVTLPFNGYIEIPGARAGDTVEVEFAGVEDECEEDVLIDPCTIRGLTTTVYKKVREKVIVKIEVKVLRPVQITVDPKMPNICP